ncbi:MAG TPA: DUF177 domain-containing protein [Bacteroidia bacterium]|nr:DUF177 domain-containing protein [Bacteroidia bacterium]
MKKPEGYTIQLAGLSAGQHTFDFIADDKFFARYDQSIVQHGKVDVTVTLLKQERVMILDFSYEGWVQLTCHRCLEEFDLPLVGDNRLLVKWGTHTEEESDEIITIASGESSLDVSQYIYEYINLMIPLRTVHPDDADGNSLCNKETLQILNKHLVKQEEEKETSD